MNVTLCSITPHAEKQIMYFARVSNPSNQQSGNVKLLRYLIDHKHWSPFEHAHASFEIETSIPIAMQLLRHRFNVQQYSMRYAEATLSYESYPARRQDVKNRQHSINDMSEEEKQWFLDAQLLNWLKSYDLYREALKKGIAKEQARFLLPLGVKTRLYITNNLRGFIHYFQVRCHRDTQKEHRDIAIAMMNILSKHIPYIARACQWNDLFLQYLLQAQE